MKVTVLAENTVAHSECKAQHGLSVYIQTERHKILFDTGSDDLFVKNARVLGIDIGEVDSLVLSHGHFDHGGGLQAFLLHNEKADIYVHAKAFEPHFISVVGWKVPIGLERSLAQNTRMVYTAKQRRIDEEAFLFADVQGKRLLSTSVRKLYAKQGKQFVHDDFAHEQNLMITENGRSVLFAGCAHNGILNIVQEAQKHTNQLTACVGGFHLFNPPTGKYESNALMQELAYELGKTNIHFYTCHCTGMKAYRVMREVMGDKLEYLSTGSTIEL